MRDVSRSDEVVAGVGAEVAPRGPGQPRRGRRRRCRARRGRPRRTTRRVPGERAARSPAATSGGHAAATCAAGSRSRIPVDDFVRDADHGLAVDDLRIDVSRRREHEARDRELLGKPLRAAERVDGLDGRRALDDDALDVGVGQRREDRPDVTKVVVGDVRLGPLEIGMRRIDVLRRVEQMAADVLGIDDVRRLDDRRQRHPPVGDVEGVVRADAPRGLHDDADDAEVATVVLRDCGREFGREEPPRERRQQA